MSKFFIFHGPSGAGKSFLAKKLVSLRETATYIRSCTTRKRRDNEGEEEYIFCTDDEFDKLSDKLIEKSEVYGNKYGIPYDELMRVVWSGQDAVTVMDYQGVIKMRDILPQDTVVSVLVTSSEKFIRDNLESRSCDSKNRIDRDLSFDFFNVVKNDIIIINDGDDNSIGRVLEKYDEYRKSGEQK